MAQHAVRNHRLTFNTDGRPHPLVNSLATITLVLGAISIISSAFSSQHLLSSWTGIVGIVTGGWGQFISATTVERFALIIGIGMSAVGFYIGVAHGGLTGGLW